MAYAEKTSVPVERSRAEIEKLLTRYGADSFASGWDGPRAMIGFRCRDRMVRFVLSLPDPASPAFKPKRSSWRRTGEDARRIRYEAELRRRWRSLALVIKAKLEAVETGITTFENEFMAHIVLPDGRTVAQHVGPAIDNAYVSGKMPKLLMEFSGD